MRNLPIFGIYLDCVRRSLWIITTFVTLRDHPFKTSAFLIGGGVKNWPNLPANSSKKLPTEGGRGQRSWKFADVFNQGPSTVVVMRLVVWDRWPEFKPCLRKIFLTFVTKDTTLWYVSPARFLLTNWNTPACLTLLETFWAQAKENCSTHGYKIYTRVRYL